MHKTLNLGNTDRYRMGLRNKSGPVAQSGLAQFSYKESVESSNLSWLT